MKRRLLVLAMFLGLGMGQPLAAQSPLERVTGVDLKGQPVNLERVAGKITALVLANRDNADQAAEVGQDIVFALGNNKNFAFMSVADLRGVPDFARNIAIDIIQEKAAKARAEMKERVTKAGRVYTPELWIYVTDWYGNLTTEFLKSSPLAEFSIFDRELNSLTRFDRERIAREQQQLRNHVHVFILDSKGEIKAHYLDRGAASQAITMLQSLLTQKS